MSNYFKESKKINLDYSEEEWDILNMMAQKQGFPDFRSYLNSQLRKLATKINNKQVESICEDCSKRRNQFHIPPDIKETIVVFSKKNCTGVVTLLKRHIITPLFDEYIASTRP